MGLLERIKCAIAQHRVEYWIDKANPPNLERAEFDEFIALDPNFAALKMVWRKSGDGVHGLDGEDYVYHGDVTVGGFGVEAVTYYVKFFFWRKGDPHIDQGVEVQSFRK